jgi:hypothetical protein
MQHARRSEVPAAYVVTGPSAGPPVRLRIGEALAPLREAGRDAVQLFFGLWPIWVVLSFGMGLVWAFAMGDSP